MRKVIILLMLIINCLTLYSSSYLIGKKKEKDHVVLRGKFIFKEKGVFPIKFYLEDKMGGNYQLVIFEDEPTRDSSFLIKKGIIVKNIIKQKIWSKLDSLYLKKEKNINYLLIPFSNEELSDQNHLQIIFLGIKIIYELEKEMGCSIYAHLE